MSSYLLYDDRSRYERARERADRVSALCDLVGKRVLEVGCGDGDFCRFVADTYGCDAVGVDLRQSENWNAYSSDRVSFVAGDISKGLTQFSDDSFDVIVSFVVWEHVVHPYSALRECQRLLRPNGVKYMHAYMYGWPRYSHLYRETNLPWLHLTHSSREIKLILNRSELPWYYWCNRLTYQHYLFYFRQLGFIVHHETMLADQDLPSVPSDSSSVLELFPTWDLQNHGFQVLLRFDPANPKLSIPDPVYASNRKEQAVVAGRDGIRSDISREVLLVKCNICNTLLDQPLGNGTYECSGCRLVTRHRAAKACIDAWGDPTEGRRTIACFMRDDERSLLFQKCNELLNFDIRPIGPAVKQMDIQDLQDVEDNSFGCFIAMHVLSCVLDDERALDEVHRVLSHGGVFFCTIPFSTGPVTLPVSDVTRDYGRENLEKYGVGTYRIYSLDVFCGMLRDRFSELREFEFYDPLTSTSDVVFWAIK
ncbi:MAG: methyltransferase domain-containing protein [Microcystis panniformis Mp_MB_F_20080800_S26]|nr:MAG: methyltransferase domain-containing protein [Microcystis panniformis Mp_MB_F_20080800_S26]